MPLLCKALFISYSPALHFLFHTFSRVTPAFLMLSALSAVGAAVVDATAVAAVSSAEVEVAVLPHS